MKIDAMWSFSTRYVTWPLAPSSGSEATMSPTSVPTAAFSGTSNLGHAEQNLNFKCGVAEVDLASFLSLNGCCQFSFLWIKVSRPVRRLAEFWSVVVVIQHCNHETGLNFLKKNHLRFANCPRHHGSLSVLHNDGVCVTSATHMFAIRDLNPQIIFGFGFSVQMVVDDDPTTETPNRCDTFF